MKFEELVTLVEIVGETEAKLGTQYNTKKVPIEKKIIKFRSFSFPLASTPIYNSKANSKTSWRISSGRVRSKWTTTTSR